MSFFEKINDIVQNDIDPDFIKTSSIAIGWAYADLYRTLAEREAETGEDYCLEEFGRRRGTETSKALAKAAKQHGIPYEFKYLPCNGQSKLIVKVGRMVLIQEPILTLDDDPRVSEYKLELADAHGLIRQLELDLGDRPLKTNAWSGCILGVVLHGSVGPRFTSGHKNLGGLLLAVPDADYRSWVRRFDLLSLGMEGRGIENNEERNTTEWQPDRVQVSLKRKNIWRGE